LVTADERDGFVERIRTKHFHGNGIRLPESPGWLGEYPWGRVYSWLGSECRSLKQPWLQENKTQVMPTACEITDNSLLVPSPKILELLGASWSGRDLEFIDASGATVALNPAVRE